MRGKGSLASLSIAVVLGESICYLRKEKNSQLSWWEYGESLTFLIALLFLVYSMKWLTDIVT